MDMQLSLAFVMDPLERVNVRTDTSFALMATAAERGHRVLWVPPNGVELDQDRPYLRAHHVELVTSMQVGVSTRGRLRIPASDCAAIFIRTDPPFNADYLTATWLLSFAERAGVRIINSPAGLRRANEKLYALELAPFCPPTIVTAQQHLVRAFLAEHGGEAIAKPIHGHGGRGVFRLREGDTNLAAILDTLTAEGREPIIVQSYLAEVTERGDRRLFMIDGVLRGVLRRIPAPGEHRSNVHVGGRAAPCEASATDHVIAQAVGPRLREDGLFFAGLDVIGDRLIEVNVTSPTLVQELRRFGGPDLTAEIIDAVERGVAASPPRPAPLPRRARAKPD